MSLIDDVDHNFSRFSLRWREDLSTAQRNLEQHEEKFRLSYRRIISIQSWRENVLEPQLPGEALGFFEEAQNDLLSGHILACSGGWRYALKSLRSFIENSLSFLYFKDHPIELQRWQIGSFKIGFSDLLSYLDAHPTLHGYKSYELGLTSLKKEYGILSRAVHASGKDFRMTNQGEVNRVFLGNEIPLNKWANREKETVNSINTLYLFFFRDFLRSTNNRNHRQALGLTFPQERALLIREKIGVNIIS